MSDTTLRVGAPEPLESIEAINTTLDRKLLIRNGCVLSMDSEVGDLAKGDVLVEGDRITKIAADLSLEASEPGVTVIDAT
ncbi:MAG TPA: hypothetical protein VI193_10700, partial [Acidimicrobiia bacterium]